VISIFLTVPPKHLSIVTPEGAEVDSIVGPLKEGSTLQLICRAEGGSPTPRVTWWDGERLLDSLPSSRGQSVTTTLKIEPRRVSNTLLIEPITRSDLHRSLRCKASNTNLSSPLTGMVSVDMTRELN